MIKSVEGARAAMANWYSKADQGELTPLPLTMLEMLMLAAVDEVEADFFRGESTPPCMGINYWMESPLS